MDPVTAATTVALPREQVFEYVVDIANLPEYTDHFLVDWRMTREDTYGRGAGARFRAKRRGDRFGYADLVLHEVEHPRRILARGRAGKFNRIRVLVLWELEATGPEATRVAFTVETETRLPSDRIAEALWGKRWWQKRLGKALRRLRSILEEDEGRGARATISGGPRKPATGTPLRSGADR